MHMISKGKWVKTYPGHCIQYRYVYTDIIYGEGVTIDQMRAGGGDSTFLGFLEGREEYPKYYPDYQKTITDFIGTLSQDIRPVCIPHVAVCQQRVRF